MLPVRLVVSQSNADVHESVSRGALDGSEDFECRFAKQVKIFGPSAACRKQK